MNMQPERMTADRAVAEHFDVLIVGAGISGIDAAYHLQKEHPERSFVMLEKQAGFGGTWRTHKYPGIRSDSDLHTFGFSWKPWMGATIAKAEAILEYLDEAMEEQGLRERVRYGKSVETAEWSSDDRKWVLTVRDVETGAVEHLSCGFLWMCQGYYKHEQGYTPEWPGMERFKGEIVHPQTWPEDLETEGKRIVVIGSGATAATLVPAVAERCAHVTMLQRSPTYFYPRPIDDEFKRTLRALDLPQDWYHEIMRRKVLRDQAITIKRSFEEPDALRADLLAGVTAYMGPDFPLDPHFTPTYRPWRQRLAVVPDGDLFKAMKAGKASVVTDQIEAFEEGGIRVKSGELLEADIIVTATGFELLPLGGVEFLVDGARPELPKEWMHRGIMFTGFPNLAWVFGYLRTSWTMRADLVADYVCRLLGEMDARGASMVVPELRPEDRQMEPRPWIDVENFNAGYLLRGHGLMPRQGDREPWVHSQDYETEKDSLPAADFGDGTLRFA